MSQTALNIAISGIRNQQRMMDVIANNIANAGTTGYKRGRMTFEESFSQVIKGALPSSGGQGGVNPIQRGSGATIGSIDSFFEQGDIEATGTSTDLAIVGDGFFVVNDGQQNFFSRAGGFQWDAEGTLVMPSSGMKVQGRLADSFGYVSEGSPIGDINVQLGISTPAKQTSKVDFVGNLDAASIPVGNILATESIYAREVPGETTDINRLYARGNTNVQLTGMTNLSTIVTISSSEGISGEGKTKTYTYVNSDSGDSNLDFHSLDDLIAEINSDFSGTHLTASLNSVGAIEFVNDGAVGNTMEFGSSNSVLNRALASADGVVGDYVTDEFSHVARGTDEVINLRKANGVDLGLSIDDTIKISAIIGGNSIDSIPGDEPDPFLVTVAGDDGNSITYSDLVNQVKSALNLANPNSAAIDEISGAMVITADGGSINEVSGVNITTDSETLGGGAEVFDSVFDATIYNWSTKQVTSDVTHSSSVSVVDSLGNNHTLTLLFTKNVTLPNHWNWEASIPEPAELSGGYEGIITFDQEGALETFSYSHGAKALTFDPKTGADIPVEVVLNMGVLGETSGVTQFSYNSTAIAQNQDGYSSGVLDNIMIQTDGTVTGIFSNGVSRDMAVIVLANFNNQSGLLRAGENVYTVSGNSGNPIYRTVATATNAKIISGSVEMSNVDIAQEFTNMIVAQRAFQANARTVTATDELMQEAVNMKR